MPKRKKQTLEIEVFLLVCLECRRTGRTDPGAGQPLLAWTHRTIFCPHCRQPMAEAPLTIGGSHANILIDLFERLGLFAPAALSTAAALGIADQVAPN